VGPGTAQVNGVAGSGMVGGGCTTSQAQGGWHCCGLENGIIGLGMAHAWLMVSPARVREVGNT
jgi:hypothetical protein